MPAIILMAFLAAGTSPLPDDVPFNEGLQLLEDFEYEKAIFRFREAVRDPDKTAEQRAICHIYVGVTLAELREDAGAIGAFEEAVRADASATLPVDASPKVKEMLRTARANIASDIARMTEPEAAPVPAPKPAPGLAPEPERPAESDDGNILFLASGGALAAAGVAAVAGAGGLFALALNFNQQAEDAEFASDAASARDSSVFSQVGAGVAVGAGALLVAGGAALLVFGFVE